MPVLNPLTRNHFNSLTRDQQWYRIFNQIDESQTMPSVEFESFTLDQQLYEILKAVDPATTITSKDFASFTRYQQLYQIMIAINAGPTTPGQFWALTPPQRLYKLLQAIDPATTITQAEFTSYSSDSQLYEIYVAFGGGPSSFDPDAQDFFNRAGITDDIEKDAINQFVLFLKALPTTGGTAWDDSDAIYPFAGTTAASQSHNLKSSAFQLTWFGTVTHNAQGAQGDGVTGYADIGMLLQSQSSMTATTGHFSCYLNLASGANQCETGCPSNAADPDVFQMFTNLGGSAWYFAAFGTDTGKVTGPHTGQTTGFFIGSRDTELAFYRNANQELSSLNPSEADPPDASPFLFARNNVGSGIPDAFCSGRMGFASFGKGMNSTEASDYTTGVTSLMDALGRLAP